MESYVKLSCIFDNSIEIRRFQRDVKSIKGNTLELDIITPKIKFLQSIKDNIIYSLSIPTKTIEVIKLSNLLQVLPSQNTDEYYKSILLYNNNEPYFISNLKRVIKTKKIDFDNDINFKIYFCADAKDDPIARGDLIYNILIRHRLITKPIKSNENVCANTENNNDSYIYLCKKKEGGIAAIFSDSKLANFYSDHILDKSNRDNVYQVKINTDKTMERINYVKELMKNKVNIYEYNIIKGEASKVKYSYLFTYSEEGIYKDNDKQFITNIKQYLKKLNIAQKKSNTDIKEMKMLFLINKNEDVTKKMNKIYRLLKDNYLLDRITFNIKRN